MSDTDVDPKPDRRQVALTFCALALLIPALLPCLVQFLPSLHFDVDPRSESGASAATAFGPAGAAWLHVYSVLAAGAAIGVSVWCGGRVRWFSCVLVAVGAGVCAYHMTTSYVNLIQGGAWVAAAALGLAALHLGQHDVARRWMIAALIAILIPIAVQAIWFVLVEHPMTVEHFRAGEDAFLESRGWERGSPQHELYVRRLESPDAIGTFGLSNVLGSIAAGLTLLSATVTLGVRGWWRLLPGAIAVLGLIAVVLTRSKGAMLILPAGVVLIALAALVLRRPRWRAVLPIAALGVIFAAVIAVVLVGVFFPRPDVEASRALVTLLFRSHYWEAGLRMIQDHTLLGVGPADFKAHYLATKNPLNPEEVQSVHNVFVDYIATLGLGGVAWCAVLLMWVCAAGRSVGRATSDTEGDPPGVDVRLFAAGLGVVLFGVQYVVLQPQMLIENALLWLLALGGFVLTVWALARSGAIPKRWCIAGLFVAAAAVLMHNQIEMSFYHAPAASIVWLIVGLSAAPATGIEPHESRRFRSILAGAPLAVVALVMAVAYAAPVTEYQRRLAEAAEALRRRPLPQAIASLDRAAAAMPGDDQVLRWRVALRLQLASALAAASRPDAARTMLDQTLAMLSDPDIRNAPTARVDRFRAQTQEAYANMLGDPSQLDDAAMSMELMLTRNPYSIRDLVHLAELYHDRLDRPDRAADLYERALELSGLNYLDPAKQLTDKERQRIEQRLQSLR